MVRERGYPGAPDHFRALVARLRPRPAAEAYLRLRTLPGEQGQVDWAHFGKLSVGRAVRPLMAFVMVLSYSRHLFLRFYFGASMSYFVRAHVEAFTYFDALPRVLLYDNLKSAVLERCGDAIHFHPRLLELAAHYRFQPRPVALARGNEKGRVERAIRFVREAFFAARGFRDLDDLNAQAKAWCEGAAADRPCPEERAHSVCLPTDLSDEAAAKLVEFMHELTAALERHYFAQLRRHYSATDITRPDLDPDLELGSTSSDPPF
jgi:transposase